MKTVIDIDGKVIKIDDDDYKNMRKAFTEGCDGMGVKFKGRWHQIPLVKNFTRTGFREGTANNDAALIAAHG